MSTFRERRGFREFIGLNSEGLGLGRGELGRVGGKHPPLCALKTHKNALKYLFYNQTEPPLGLASPVLADLNE